MMSQLRYRFLMIVLLVMLVGASSLYAQTQWDSVLDKYEQICNQCIDLRQRIIDGESVPARSLTSLLQDLSTLRSTLQNGAGSMSAAQKRRFERIRDRYSLIAGSSESRTSQPAAAPQSSVKKQNTTESKAKTSDGKSSSSQNPVVLPEAVEQTVSAVARDEIMLFRVDSSFHAAATLINDNLQLPIPHKESSLPIDVPAKADRSVRFGAILQAGYHNNPAYGVRGVLMNNRIGVYASLLSDMDFEGGEYTISSDGSILEGGSFWSDGSSRRAFFCASAGMMYKAFDKLLLGVGGGYYGNSLYWKDIGGAWAEVNDLTHRGLMVEATAAYTYKVFMVSASMQLMPSSMTVTPVIGVGFLF